MKTIRLTGLLVTWGVVLAGSSSGSVEPRVPGAQEIAEHTELVIEALRGQSAAGAATIVLQAETAILASKWQTPHKRTQVVTLITYAVAAEGKDAASMMGLVAAGTPPAWLKVIAATATMAAGESSSAVAKAMLAAVAGDAQAVETCRAACANPATVLSPAELGTLRGLTLPTPSLVPAKSPLLPTYIPTAEKYPGQ